MTRQTRALSWISVGAAGALGALVLAGSCGTTDRASAEAAPYHPRDVTSNFPPPESFAFAESVDGAIEPGEVHFAHLWKLTRGVENAAEGYFSFAGDRLVYQATPAGAACDRIYVTAPARADQLVSSGAGGTTCAYFLPGDREVIYASTHGFQVDCPTRPDLSQGYVWPVYAEFDIYVQDLATGAQRAWTTSWGYDAEATVSPRGDRVVFTSSRSGDLELWTADLDGGNAFQVTRTPGYDGGAFFSHDGEWLVFRATAFTPGREDEEQATYEALLRDWKVRPHSMDIMVIRADGTERRRVTSLGQASFAPYFFPDDRRILFASNHHDKRKPAREFDLFAVDADGANLERVTTYEGFDSFPMFSPDGRWLVFASNRAGSKQGETNLFLAEWKP